MLRGTRAGASGEIQIVPTAPHFVGAGLSHAGPWDYVQRVPLLFYGPGIVPANGRVHGGATLADIAPTVATWLDFPFEAPDGHALVEATQEDQVPAPRLIVTLVWDGGGRDVLDRWPDDWPFLSSLVERGTWYEDATVGSSPTNTPPSHATIGTGAFPRTNGVVDLYQEVDGVIAKPSDGGPGTLLLPTLADSFDLAMDNESKVGLVATLGAHTGMIGHGATWPGGDRDVAVLREDEDSGTGGDEGRTWELTEPMRAAFHLPDYVDDVPGFDADVAALDQSDGALDGNWHQYPLDALDDGFQTPARAPYQTRIVESVVEREGFGLDDVPDLLYVNLKAIDSVGHIFSADGHQMGETVRWHDDALAELVGWLDDRVGSGRWAMVLTADHGAQRDPERTGALSIGVDHITHYLDGQFADRTNGASIVRRVRPTQIWLRNDVLSAAGISEEDVAAALRTVTLADLAGDVPYQDDPETPAFATAFPSSTIQRLGCLPK